LGDIALLKNFPQVSVNKIVMQELKKVIQDADVSDVHCTEIHTELLSYVQIMQEDDKLWPVPDRIGRQVS
jgi:hypothetical protein